MQSWHGANARCANWLNKLAHDWVWIATEVAVEVHREQLIEHGGSHGIKDFGSLESAMARPLQLAVHAGPDVAALAAAYAYGIVRNHPFVDGNKRTAAVISEAFLDLNGFGLGASDAELVVAFVDLAAGALDERELADWFRTHIVSQTSDL